MARQSVFHRGASLFVGFVLVLSGCGKQAKVDEEASTVRYVPEYPSLPEDAPLSDRLEEAAAVIDRELLEEQEKFYLKRFEDIRSLYTDEHGDLLISDSSLAAMKDMMDLPNRVRLKIRPVKFYFRAPKPPNQEFRESYRGVVHLLGETVPAQADYADRSGNPRVYLHLEYRYEISKPDSFEIERKFRIDRYFIYRKTENDLWKRVRVVERAPSKGTASVP